MIQDRIEITKMVLSRQDCDNATMNILTNQLVIMEVLLKIQEELNKNKK